MVSLWRRAAMTPVLVILLMVHAAIDAPRGTPCEKRMIERERGGSLSPTQAYFLARNVTDEQRSRSLAVKRDCHWIDWKKKLECEEVEVSAGEAHNQRSHSSSNGLGAVAALAHWSLTGEAKRHSRITVILYGQTARPNCVNKAKQFEAIRSQRRELFTPLQAKGFEVEALLATNACGEGWAGELRRAYGDYLTDLALDNCKGAKDQRCLLHRALQLWDRQRRDGDTGPRSRDLVLLTRPDMLWFSRGPELVVALVHLASQKKFVWPFKCEDDAWDHWKCVADTAVALPARMLAAYRHVCLGRVSCHPDARGDGQKLFFDNERSHAKGYGVGGGYSGHGCYRCMLGAIEADPKVQAKSAAAVGGRPEPLEKEAEYRCFAVDSEGGVDAWGKCSAECKDDSKCSSWVVRPAADQSSPNTGILASLLQARRLGAASNEPATGADGCHYVAWKHRMECPSGSSGASGHDAQNMARGPKRVATAGPRRSDATLHHEVQEPSAEARPVAGAQSRCCIRGRTQVCCAPPLYSTTSCITLYEV